MHLGTVQILIPYRFTWVNELQKTDRDFFIMSNLWCQLFSTLFYCGILTKRKQENIIIDTVSTNIGPLCHTYLYVNQRTKLKCKNIYIGMVTRFKNNSQWSRSVITFLLLAAGTIAPKIPNFTKIFFLIYSSRYCYNLNQFWILII